MAIVIKNKNSVATLKSPPSTSLKAVNSTVTLNHDYGKTKVTLDDMDSTTGWSAGFDDDAALVSDTSLYKDGSASIKETIRLAGDPSTLFNSFDDHTDADISVIGDATFSTNTTTFKEGTGAINIISDGTWSNAGLNVTFSQHNFSDNTHKLCFWFYVKDQTTLDKIDDLALFVSHDGLGWNKWNTDNDNNVAPPQVGWNFYRMTVKLEEATEGGGADESAIDRFRIRVYKNQVADTFAEGDVIIDELRRYSQSGYGSVLDYTYNGDWSGHSESDRISFWFYCPDVTKFYALDFSFGDAVSGETQYRAIYSWTVDAGTIVDGWNYLSALIADFSLSTSYTFDSSDIKQLRFTTRYSNDTTINTPYLPDEELEVNIDSLKLEKNIYITLKEVS